ncbi:MAG: NAD(P)/FAD-dependent oxidoreductase [Acidobacteria bacterium]|nr:NAD(P)/FAD-dependent oxidoreductase [Acidobacteriota bacterium]
MTLFDVAITGGGPAGAWAAFNLASGGARVALIDASHPREKPCGGGVSARALALLGSSVQQVANGVAIDSARFIHRDRQLTMPLVDSEAGMRLAVVPRMAFDGDLLARAEQAGATIVRERVTDVQRLATRWSVSTPTGEIEAAWLVGADGPASLVRRRVSSPFAREDLSIAAGYYVHGVTSRQIDIAFDDDPSGYLWSFPRHDHVAVGACAQANVTSTSRLLALTERWIAVNVDGGTRQRYSWPIPSLGVAALERQQPSGERWLLVGDAAGLVDPITREGIFYALLSGAYAATSILEHRDASRSYAESLRDGIYSELILAARLKARFFQPRFMGLLISALQRSGRIRAVMSDLVAGEQAYGTLRRRLVATLEVRLMIQLFGGQRT